MSDKNAGSTHFVGCADSGPRHYDCLLAERDSARSQAADSLTIRNELLAALTKAEAERDAYAARCAGLVDALEPFAKAAEKWNDIPGILKTFDNVELWQRGDMRVDYITVGDLRKARKSFTDQPAREKATGALIQAALACSWAEPSISVLQRAIDDYRAAGGDQ